MGLDMYLRKKIYIGANYERNNVKGEINITRGEDNTPVKINLNKVTYIIEDAGYWRKANAIHRWMVESVQNDEDDCKEYYVSDDKLEELLSVCKQVKANPILAPELLPTQEGFFFGGTDYEECYWNDIDCTIKIIEDIFSEKEENGYYPFEIYYQSSW
jgi:hypothetical protein